MLRESFSDSLRDALKAKDGATVSTLRLILSQLKDRDIALRAKGGVDAKLADDDILGLLQAMIKQRQESIRLYREGGREELAAREAGEIAIIERFLPAPMTQAEAEAAIEAAVAEAGATSVKDMGRVMALLKQRFAGRLDLAAAGAAVRRRLG